jgi:choline kinase
MTSAKSTSSTAIILAAGYGSRLLPYTSDRPKCLVEAFGTPILAVQLRQLRELRVDHVVIVVGYQHAVLADYVRRYWSHMRIELVVNTEFASSGTGLSAHLGFGRHERGDVLLMEGDVVFDRTASRALGAASELPFGLVTEYRPPLSGSFVSMNAGNRMLRCLHASVRDPAEPLTGLFKTVNLWRFPYDVAIGTVRPGLARWIERSDMRFPLEYFIDDLLQSGLTINGVALDLRHWYEIDDAQDLERAKQLFPRTSDVWSGGSHGIS